MSDCLACRHLNDPVDGGCAAYARIPHDIISSEVGHDEVRGDEDRADVAFEPRPLPGGNGQAQVVAHLSGKHDQRRHGRPGPSSGRAGMGDVPVTDAWVSKMRGGSAEAHLVRRPDGTMGFSPERQALHDAAITEALAGKTEVANPSLLVLGGGPASGKSRTLRTQRQVDPNTVTANFDNMKNRLPEYQDRIAAGDLDAAAFTHAESAYMSSRLQAAAVENRMNLVADSTGDGPPAGMRAKIGRAKAAGYRVEGLYVTTDVDQAVARSESRLRGEGSGTSKGRYIPPSIIREVHGNVSAVVPEIYQDFDAFDLFDTSEGGAGRHVLTYRDGATSVVDQAGWDRFVAKGEGVEL